MCYAFYIIALLSHVTTPFSMEVTSLLCAFQNSNLLIVMYALSHNFNKRSVTIVNADQTMSGVISPSYVLIDVLFFLHFLTNCCVHKL